MEHCRIVLMVFSFIFILLLLKVVPRVLAPTSAVSKIVLLCFDDSVEGSLDDFQYFEVIKCEEPDEKSLSIYNANNELVNFENILTRKAEASKQTRNASDIELTRRKAAGSSVMNSIEISSANVRKTVEPAQNLKISSIHFGKRKKMDSLYRTNITIPLPDEKRIVLLRPIKHMYKMFLLGKPLENNDRTKISKAVIDECLKYNPERILSREDFFKLANTITEVFKTEVQSVYYVPSAKSIPARGKLFNAYNNKRTTLSSEGLISRRTKKNSKRVSPNGIDLENLNYLEQNCSDSDWPNIVTKWRQTYKFRQAELKSYESTYDYIKKYPALQRENGIELVNIDLKMLYPNVAEVSNWMSLYPKVVNRARSFRDNAVASLVAEIDNSSDERYKAGLSLILIAYILPNSGKRSESGLKKATKSEIQRRFIKEYPSVNQIDAEQGETTDLQIKFVKEDGAIIYADFTIAGFKFKCGDILQALNIGLQYIMALDEKYPNICLHVWQFVQLAIFKIELPDTKVPFIETTINDLLMDGRSTNR